MLAYFFQSLTFGVTVGFMLLGVVGVIVPVFPGMLLVWLSLLGYAIFDGFHAIGWGLFLVLSLFALATGTADLWLPLVGAKATGASRRGMIYGTVGALAGFLIFNLPGAIIGYALGVVLGEYQRHGDWRQALRASMGGLAGMGVSTLIQLGASIIILVVFVWRVLSF
ncbi:MAG: DUF456 domain-containing protein [Anaerolineales bacterium]|nr:DUF456 domain-containing protein [Anaerolineales bacterium]MCB8952489.1 DUF456 domain-containing protein [Ardenticatenales bacterium]